MYGKETSYSYICQTETVTTTYNYQNHYFYKLLCCKIIVQLIY